MGTRRAVLFATGSRYLTLMLQVAVSFFVAHHVLPDQFGLTVLGNGVLLAATALRDLGTTGYLVQEKELDPFKVRTAFTLSLIITALVTVALFFAAGPIARFYNDPQLVQYLRLMACAFALGPFIYPIIALLARDLAFGAMAVIDVGAAVAGALTTIVLIRLDLGFISVAWGVIARALVALLLSFAVKRDLWLYKPSLRAWRSVLGYGLYGTTTALIYTFSEALIYLVLGKLLDVRSVGLLQRAYLLTQVPERVVLAGVGAVAVPAFARLARNGEPLVAPYTRTIRLIAPIYMFVMVALAVMARPLILVLLGPQWGDAATLLQLMAAGHVIGLGVILNGSVLVAVGGIRRAAPLALFQVLVVIGSLAAAAPFGLIAVAATAFVTVPINTYASYFLTRRWIAFSWRDISGAGVAGAVATAIGVVPALLLSALGWQEQHPLALLVLGATAGGLSWLLALRLMRHPLFDEFGRVIARLSGVIRSSAQA